MTGNGRGGEGQCWRCRSNGTTQVYPTDIPFVTMGCTVDTSHFLQGGPGDGTVPLSIVIYIDVICIYMAIASNTLVD